MTASKENRDGFKENPRGSSRARVTFSRSRGWHWLLIAAAAFRFFGLGLKPPHFDEGINGHFVITIWRDGFYSYDPTNFHGPLYFYLCQLAEILFGRGVESFRIMNAALSMALVFTVFQFRKFLGHIAIWAAWILALSPAFVFYGRYAIHETLFVLGQILFAYGRFSWMGEPTRRAAGWMALGAVILLSTKETFFIFFGTWIIAELGIRFFEASEISKPPWVNSELMSSEEKRSLRIQVLAILGLAVFILAALFSGFFEHTKGLTDFFKAFDFWSQTGTKGNGHEKPFIYWLELLSRYEWPLLMGLITSLGATLMFKPAQRKQRLLLLVGFGHWLAYSLIPYKTPWLILNFWPLAFSVWSSSEELPSSEISRAKWFEKVRWPFVYRLALLGSILAMTYQTWHLNFVNYADGREPYVYVQTTTDYSQVMTVLKRKIERSPEIRNASIVVMIQDPWPLPFDLSLFPKMRYARLEDIDRDASILRNADVMLIDGSILDGLRRVFPKRFARLPFQLRDAYGAGWALFDAEKFSDVLPPDAELEAKTESKTEKVAKPKLQRGGK